MAKADSTERTTVNGFKPVSRLDIECFSHIVMEQAKAFEAIFRAISRLSDDRDVKALCGHGASEASLQANDIDVIRERVMKAGFDAEVTQ
jgi:glyoxylase-like metal-dependent hydrolase (beta-lactamase superfamily II)